MFPWKLHWYTSPPTVHKHSFFSSSLITFVISYLLVLAIQTGMRWYLLCFWSAFHLITSDAEHLVIYLLIIYVSFFVGKCLFFKDVVCIMFTIFQYMKLSCLPTYQQQAIRKWNKENNPIYYCIKKDKTLRNKWARCWKILCKTFGEGGSGWGTRVYLWWIHVDVWQNQYNIVK